MQREVFARLEEYMLSCMKDSAHDKEHIYRVLYLAMEIAEAEKGVYFDVLIAACLLHDIGRQAQLENPSLCHASVGAQMAYTFLLESGVSEALAQQVHACILTHRFRKDDPPRSIEAKILYDADKIDVCGATGVARTLLYKGQIAQPLYTLLPDGRIDDTSDGAPSFFQEYKRKLEHITARLFTKKGKELAARRQPAAAAFYNCLREEVRQPYHVGRRLLENEIDG